MKPSEFLKGLDRLAEVVKAMPEDAHIIGAGFDSGFPSYIQVSGCIGQVSEIAGKEITTYTHGGFREYQVDFGGITVCQLPKYTEEAS